MRSLIFVCAVVLSRLALAGDLKSEEPVWFFLEAGPDAPLPRTVVEFDYSSAEPAPLVSFRTHRPTRVDYLIQRRVDGAYAEYLMENPELPRARLERRLIAYYEAGTDLEGVMVDLEMDKWITNATLPPNVEFVLPAAEQKVSVKGGGFAPEQYGRDSMSIDAAWALATGHSVVAILDSGLQMDHPELVSFSSGSFVFGNFLEGYAYDTVLDELGEVDELKPMPTKDPACDRGDGFAVPDIAGHGTHVSGLVAANSMDDEGTSGVCANCVIAMAKVTNGVCVGGTFLPSASEPALGEALVFVAGSADIQVASMSLKTSATGNQCSFNPPAPSLQAICDGIDLAEERDVLLVAASGNDRTDLDFPAADGYVVAAGGHDELPSFWNEDKDPPPNDTDDCPLPGSSSQCGSNYTLGGADPKQEVLSAARQVVSTTYAGQDWNTFFECGDNFGFPAELGYGHCTGTSMSAPQIAGVLGLLRSVNPLVEAGDPFNMTTTGVRDVLATTSDRGQANLPWDMKLGHGIPDARVAAQMMLGEVDGVLVYNRLTPLFALYGDTTDDHAYSVVPQFATTLITSASYDTAVGDPVTGYPLFPSDGFADFVTPSAEMYIFTTHWRPSPSEAKLRHVFLLDRSRAFPVGCSPGPGCNEQNRDYLLSTDVDDLESLVAEGYVYRGIRGYVHDLCSPEPACVPAGAETVFRQCNATTDDCAIFLESDQLSYNGQGFTAPAYVGAPIELGYAYPNVDTDSDDLIDGFESLLGMNALSNDSDGDSVVDGVEFPLAGVQVSDPCDGPVSTCNADLIFYDGFVW